MADEPVEKRGFMEMAVEAVAFTKIIVIGLLVVLFADVAASFWLASHPVAEQSQKSVEFVLMFFKDMALFIVGAIAGLLQHKDAKP